MESPSASSTTPRGQESNKNPSPSNSPTSNNGGINNNIPSPLIPISRSEPNNPYPTTFVQADTSTFKQVVQMLTGSPELAKPDPPVKSFAIPPIKTNPPKRQIANSFKLYERRNNNNSLKHTLMINTLLPNNSNLVGLAFPPRNPEILSPSMLDFPKLVLSPVTPLNGDPFNKASPSLANSSSSEERAIAEKGFYLHPSPLSTPRDSEPQLLPLFPVTSPRVSEASS